MNRIEKSYELAQEQYAALGIDTDAAIEKALSIPISLHCWQADDNVGFEPMDEVAGGGGILATGNHPGRARTAEEVRKDLAKSISLIPGIQRVNVHSYYAEFDEGFTLSNADAGIRAFWIEHGKRAQDCRGDG